MPFYYLILFWAVLAYLVVVYVSRSPFGLALQGIRDNARRMAALGFNVTAHRIAAYAFAALIAAIAGVLLVWHGGQISPGTAGVGPVIDILIIAVVGRLEPADRRRSSARSSTSSCAPSRSTRWSRSASTASASSC